MLQTQNLIGHKPILQWEKSVIGLTLGKSHFLKA